MPLLIISYVDCSKVVIQVYTRTGLSSRDAIPSHLLLQDSDFLQYIGCLVLTLFDCYNLFLVGVRIYVRMYFQFVSFLGDPTYVTMCTIYHLFCMLIYIHIHTL